MVSALLFFWCIMPFRVNCPSCRTELRVPDHLADSRIKCPQCGQSILARESAEGVQIINPGMAKRRPRRWFQTGCGIGCGLFALLLCCGGVGNLLKEGKKSNGDGANARQAQQGAEDNRGKPAGLSEEKRKAVFWELWQAGHRANDEANRKFGFNPYDPNDPLMREQETLTTNEQVERWRRRYEKLSRDRSEYLEPLARRYKNAVAAKYGLSEEQRHELEAEPGVLFTLNTGEGQPLGQ